VCVCVCGVVAGDDQTSPPSTLRSFSSAFIHPSHLTTPHHTTPPRTPFHLLLTQPSAETTSAGGGAYYPGMMNGEVPRREGMWCEFPDAHARQVLRPPAGNTVFQRWEDVVFNNDRVGSTMKHAFGECMSMSMSVCIYMYDCMYVCMYACMHVCGCGCVCVGV
jgi:hypothetical protein